MGYDGGDSYPLDFEPNGFPFGSKSKGKQSPRSYPIQYEWKWNMSFLSVHATVMHDLKHSCHMQTVPSDSYRSNISAFLQICSSQELKFWWTLLSIYLSS